MHDAWHPIRCILSALSALLWPRNPNPAEHEEEPFVSVGHIVLPWDAATAQTPQWHQPLLRALQASPAPRPWRACASRIVQLSADWYVGSKPYGYHWRPTKEVLLGWESFVEKDEVRHEYCTQT